MPRVIIDFGDDEHDAIAFMNLLDEIKRTKRPQYLFGFIGYAQGYYLD